MKNLHSLASPPRYRLPARLLFSLFLLLILSLASCVIVINQPTPEEKELLAIQETVGQQMADVGQKVQASGYSPAQIEDFIAQVENTVQQGLQRISELDIPEKTRRFADETKKYLESAQKIFTQLKNLFSNIEKLKQEGQALSDQASAAIQEQIANIQNAIGNFKNQLDQLAGQIDKARSQLLELYEKSGGT